MVLSENMALFQGLTTTLSNHLSSTSHSTKKYEDETNWKDDFQSEEEGLPGPTVPIPNAWSDYDEKILLEGLKTLLTNADGSMSAIGAIFLSAISEVCNPILTPKSHGRDFWLDYRDGEKDLINFFKAWLRYIPEPEMDGYRGPGYFIEMWDYLENTRVDHKVSEADGVFRKWFVQFLNLRERWINSKKSATTMELWMNYTGTKSHPLNRLEYVKLDEKSPDGGFKTFNQFFLRSLKKSLRPLNETAEIVSPCDGDVFYLQQEDSSLKEHCQIILKAKSNDSFKLGDALPGYGNAFIGGALLDFLLWFTDYHHFHAPVNGIVISIGEYQGSYNYDFFDYDANNPYAPQPPGDNAGWYRELNKHKRLVWIIKTEEMGLVAMIAIGFFGVGSITSEVRPMQKLKKGDYMGHFGYGGSSILLAFEPEQDIKFLENIHNADNPLRVQVRQGLDSKY
jgi:phosphatidylserine decarboxylase